MNVCGPEDFDFHLTFNTNADHVKYSRIYETLGVKRLRRVVFNKRILVTTAGIKEALAACILRYVFFNKVTMTIHDYEPHPGPKERQVRLYNRVVERLFPLHFHSKYQYDMALGSNNSVFHLPLLISEKRLCERQRRDYVLAFGRNEPYKNFPFMEKLSGELKSSGLSVVVASAGCDLRKNENFDVISEYIGDETLENLIREARLVVVPYTSCTQSGVINASHENGTPVAVTNIPGLTEYVDDQNLGTVISLQPCDAAKTIERFLAEWQHSEFLRALLKKLEYTPHLMEKGDKFSTE
ncbi:glycosyltransferase [Shimia sediminis]|uniref:glycosyltransferase n=1 Tax=Shimia sediminis TaxID=2497945 RepID=UPI000F8EAF32|nr:glycosyltransferase [Shimia sediminis]